MNDELIWIYHKDDNCAITVQDSVLLSLLVTQITGSHPPKINLTWRFKFHSLHGIWKYSWLVKSDCGACYKMYTYSIEDE